MIKQLTSHTSVHRRNCPTTNLPGRPPPQRQVWVYKYNKMETI